MQTIEIPRKELPAALVAARWRMRGDAYPCVCCGLPVPNPKMHLHVIRGGGVALAVSDELSYVPDGGDLGCQPIGADCARQHPELKPFIHR